MWWITYVFAPLVGGIIAASGFIIAKNPNAKELIDKVMPYKAIVGAIMLGTGILNLIQFVLPNLGTMFTSPIFGLGVMLIVAAELLVGFLLSFGLIAKYMGGAAEKGANLQKKLIAVEVPLGFLSIAAGVFGLLITLGILHP